MGIFGGCNGILFNPASPASYASRLPGEDCFLADPNSSFDPRKNFLSNGINWGQVAPGGTPVFGFGYINAEDAAVQRTGQIVARFSS